MGIEFEAKKMLLYARQPSFRNLLKQTNSFIERCLSECVSIQNDAYCACSFGKDSAVMLHLLRNYCPDISCVFVCYQETELLDNYEEVISQWNCNLTKLFIDVDIEAKINEKDIIPNWAIENNFKIGFVGIRAEESKGRSISLRKDGMLYAYKNKPNLYRACPLAWWTTNDIAAYTYLHKLPMLNTYTKHGIASRTTTGIADEDFGFRKSQLLRLKYADITRYNNIILQFPQLAIYA